MKESNKIPLSLQSPKSRELKSDKPAFKLKELNYGDKKFFTLSESPYKPVSKII